MRLFGRLSSVTALALSVMLLQPTASKADYHPLGSGSFALKCAALYWVATGAYPNDEGRRQELSEIQNFFHRLFVYDHKLRRKSKNHKPHNIRITNKHLLVDKSRFVRSHGERYDNDPHSLATMERTCRDWRKKQVKFDDPEKHFDAFLLRLGGPVPPKYDASDFRKSKRNVDRWFKAWTKMGRPTPSQPERTSKRSCGLISGMTGTTMLRSIKKLSSVSGLVLALTMLQPTASMADYVSKHWDKRRGIHCAALYTIATAAYPNDEGRKEKLFRLQTLFEQVFIAFHRSRKRSDGLHNSIKVTKDDLKMFYTMTRLGKRYDTEPHSLVSLLGHCQRFETVLLKKKADLLPFDILLAMAYIEPAPRITVCLREQTHSRLLVQSMDQDGQTDAPIHEGLRESCGVIDK